MRERVLDQFGVDAPEGFQLRAQGSTCSNWQSISGVAEEDYGDSLTLRVCTCTPEPL